ncbi:MAG: T9SS type A sorting domain-containing protein, partial [Bacteroidales bacterium]|nr:T9SS type A sorting domain-containing protein [Bacteroidales bacterium]
KAEVVNGEFDIRFVMPKDINYTYGKGLISFYATDYVTDANGSFSEIVIGGFDPNAMPDEDGPEARAFIDDTLFISGGITNENPVFYAFVRDKNGINMTGSGIGHDITVTLSGATNKYYELNSYYETPFDPEDYGTIAYRMYGLNEGEHHLTFRVWDIYNNSTTVSLDFTVVKSSNLTVLKPYNSPNPMTSYTNFYFEHNQKGEMDIRIDIYNISGQRVRTIRESRYGTSTRTEPIYWDGSSDNGQPLRSGIYIYNVSVTNGNNERSTGYSKLVIAH